MADASQTELATRILEKLFVLVSGETPSSQDAATVNKVIVAVNEQLRDKEVAYWSDSAIPQAVLEDLAAYIACHLANDFMDASEAVAFKTDQEHGLRASLAKLRELVATTPRVRLPTEALYF